MAPASSIRYLLPIPSPHRSDSGDSDDAVHEGDGEDEEQMVEVYQQARPLVHPHSSAAIKTLGKMLDDPELMRRMLQRNQKLTGALPPDLGASRSHHHHHVSDRQEFVVVCEEMMLGFDPQARQTREIRLPAVRQLLSYYELRVDDVAYRRWEQRLPADTERVSVSMLVQALLLWFNEKSLIEHLHKFRQQRQEFPCETTHEDTIHSGAGRRLRRRQQTLEKAHSAPHLHPFELLKQQHDATAAFDYEKCAQSLPRATKTLSETNSLKSKLIIHATQELRRKTKILSRLDPPPSPTSPLRSASTPTHAPSSSSLNSGGTADASATGQNNQTHERLHQEKLARDVLRRCTTHSLAPSNRAKASKCIPQIREQKKQQVLAKQTRLQHVETAKAFSASIAMISRHIQNEELRDLRDLHHEQQSQVVNDRKHWSRVHKAHCRALSDEKKSQHLREVHAMKAIAREELELVRGYMELRQDMLQCNRQPFALSESTSTFFQQPPEILAAKATAKTSKQKKKLLAVEKEHLEHVRSLQLLDYVYDKKCAMMEARKPKAEAALVDVKLDADAQSREGDAELGMDELWEQLRAHGVDPTAFVPPPNSPPAALKYFGASRPVLLPPFASSAARNLQ